jgi:phosphatidylinositol phospholipase C, delta
MLLCQSKLWTGCSLELKKSRHEWRANVAWNEMQVGVAGVAADTRMEQTRVMMDSWIPTWEHEFEFPLAVPELALLRVEVHESDNHQKDDFGGQTCLPVWELRPGIRSVRLCDHKGQPLRSVKLLMHFKFFPSPSK